MRLDESELTEAAAVAKTEVRLVRDSLINANPTCTAGERSSRRKHLLSLTLIIARPTAEGANEYLHNNAPGKCKITIIIISLIIIIYVTSINYVYIMSILKSNPPTANKLEKCIKFL